MYYVCMYERIGVINKSVIRKEGFFLKAVITNYTLYVVVM